MTGQVLTPDGNSLPGATVRIEQSDPSNERTLGDQTNANGNFRIEGVPVGKYDLIASFVGYQTRRREITVGPDTSPITVQLAAQTLALDGLTVTSQKRVQEVQGIPAAVSSYEGDFLDDIGVQQFDRFSDYVPGLQVQIQSPNNPGFVVRGITSDDGDARVQPRVSVCQNGVSISKSRGSVVELYDLERVEVLKGPQGTLFGRAAQIGAVNIIQHRAENTQSLRIEGGIGNENERYFTGHVNAPIVENQLFLRVASLYNRRDGVVSNKTGDALNGKETFASRGSLRWLPTDGTVVDVVANYQRDTPPGTSFKSGSFPPPAGTTDPNAAAAMGPDPVLEDSDLFLDRTVWDVTLLVDQALSSDVTLNSTTAYREFDSLERFDADGTAAPALQFDEDAEGKQFSQEVRVTYESTGRFSGFGGANFFWKDGSQRVPLRTDERSFAALLDPDVPLVNGNGQPTLVSAIPNPETGGQIPLKESHQEAYTNYGTTTAAEVFLDGTVDVTETLSVTAGLRGTFEDITGEYEVTNSEIPGRLGGSRAPPPTTCLRRQAGNSPKAVRFGRPLGAWLPTTRSPTTSTRTPRCRVGSVPTSST